MALGCWMDCLPAPGCVNTLAAQALLIAPCPGASHAAGPAFEQPLKWLGGCTVWHCLQVCWRSGKVQLNSGIIERRYQNWEKAEAHFRLARVGGMGRGGNEALQPNLCTC